MTGTPDEDGLTLGTATSEDQCEPIELTIHADPGVNAGLAPVAVRGWAGNVQVIEIDAFPFSLFADPATVDDPDNPCSAPLFEHGDDYVIEGSAGLTGGRMASRSAGS